MARRILAAVAASLLVILGAPAIASAHVLKTDGDIGGVLHINPDDNPTTDGPTDYVISFDDDSGRFSLPKCDCGVAIIQDGKTIASRQLVASSAQDSEDRYTFTKPGVYDMRFTGTPKQPAAFQSFRLDYEVRVSGSGSSAQPFPVVLGIGIALSIGLVLLGAYAMDYTDGVPTNKEHQ